MPIDPRISLGVQPLQVADPMARYGQLATIQNAQNQNALAQYQLGAAKRSEDIQNVLADAYSQSTDPQSGEIDYNKLTKIVAGNRGGAQIPAILKTRREMELAALTQREQQFKVEKSKNDFIAQAKRDTSQNPSDANLTAFKEDLIANPLFTAAEKKQYAANVDRILAMPVDQRRSFMASQGASAGELKPTVQTVNRGGQTDILNAPAFGGAPTTVATFADVPLPANVQAQKIDIARQSRPPAQPPQPQPPVAVIGPDGREIYVTREEALKNRMSPAGKVTALTESQGNATAFGMRMKESHAALKNLESKGETGTGVIRGTVGGVVGLVPFVGDKFTAATDDIFNVLPSILGGMSPEQQQVVNGRINFITAVLRKESGAAISPGEFVTAEKLYFPKPGDDATVVKQKQRARELAIKAMEIQAGPGAKSIQSLTPSTSGATSASDPLGLFNK